MTTTRCAHWERIPNSSISIIIICIISSCCVFCVSVCVCVDSLRNIFICTQIIFIIVTVPARESWCPQSSPQWVESVTQTKRTVSWQLISNRSRLHLPDWSHCHLSMCSMCPFHLLAWWMNIVICCISVACWWADESLSLRTVPSGLFVSNTNCLPAPQIRVVAVVVVCSGHVVATHRVLMLFRSESTDEYQYISINLNGVFINNITSSRNRHPNKHC